MNKGVWIMKNWKRILWVAILSFLTLHVEAQVYALSEDATKTPAFKDGERLKYAVSYKVGFVNVDVATVTFAITNAKVNGIETYHITAEGKVNSRYRWFYDLNDVYESWLDKENLRPVYFRNDLSEGDYRFRSSYLYNWDSMKVFTTARNLKHDADVKREFPLSEVSYDAIALFFNLRSLDMGANQKDRWYPLEVVFADKVRKINYKFIGKERRSVEGMGKIETLVFRCQLADASGNAFEDGSEFTIWISDDKNRIPVFVDSPIKVGSVKVRLTHSAGLKN